MTSSPVVQAHTAAEQEFGRDAPLVHVMRGAYVGGVHRGTLAAVNASNELLFSLGDPDQGAFLRSAAKPFQVMPAILSGGIDRFGIVERELAVLCASHSGEAYHTEAILSVLQKIGLDEDFLHCGTHAPLDPTTAESRLRSGVEPSPVCNNCSGAHTGMLVACVAKGWPLDSYGSSEHPLQKQIKAILAEFASIVPAAIETAGDNCHVPTFRLPVRNSALVFARLACATPPSATLADSARRVVGAMTSYPEMVAGSERFDTDLIRAAGKRVVSKGGAEGFHGAGIVASGLGLALKISDGNPRAVPPVMLTALAAVGLDLRPELDAYAHPSLRDLEGAVVGEVVAAFGANFQ